MSGSFFDDGDEPIARREEVRTVYSYYKGLIAKRYKIT
jgi:hypothetical protein